MKKILGILLIILGIALGIYVGIYLMLVGGIFQIIEACKDGFVTRDIVVGILKIIFCELGGLITYLGIAIGGYFIMEDEYGIK